MKSDIVAAVPELSIIIPAYNASKFIAKTLQTLEDQTVSRDRYQIILVDDGSKDDTLQLCQDFAAQYANILVIHKENGGVSSARNAGIEAASGKWITFVDSDDYVDGHYVEAMVTVSPEEDFVIFDTLLPCAEGLTKAKKWMQPFQDQRHDISDVMLWICENRLNPPWDKRFSLEVIRKNGIRFETGINMAEDLLFNFQYALCVDSAYVSSLAVYVYTDNPEGLCRQHVTKDRLTEYENVYKKMCRGCQSGDLDRKCSRAVNLAFLRMVARYAGQLHASGFSSRFITELLTGSEMVRKVLEEPSASYKDVVRKFLLKARLYSVCAVVFPYR